METRKFEGEFRKTLTENKEIVGDDVDAGVQLCTKVGDSVLIVFSFMHLAPRASVDRSPCNQDMIARNNFSSVDWLVKSTDPTWGIEIENDSKVGFQFFRSRKDRYSTTYFTRSIVVLGHCWWNLLLKCSFNQRRRDFPELLWQQGWLFCGHKAMEARAGRSRLPNSLSDHRVMASL
ncbi:hypothetical protein MUK42_03325 [Musa troglodytarum]|uniref:Uncharacterized protein n=1 Tax=Musa troglodytarum TaxID=320322 RepID=A0A9E7HU09_9LILI|nr:hypothetical protein MUK42_03325 [Musa troglodytarum]